MTVKTETARRIAYGSDPNQFGDLRVPSAAQAALPPVVVVHGVGYLAEVTLDGTARLAEALRQAGFVSWNLEYRRVGNPGGGFPGTLEDVGRGLDHLTRLAESAPIDLTRVVVVGHS